MSAFKSNQEDADGREYFQKPKRPWMAVGIILSMMTSCTLIIWASALPFRGLASSSKPFATRQSAMEIAEQRRGEDQQIRETAIADHRIFLDSLAKQNRLRLEKNLPGKEELQQRWTQTSKHIEAEITELTQVIEEQGAAEGSILWENRKHLMRIVADSGN